MTMIAQQFSKTRLTNGLTVVSERIPHVRSISMGVWIKSGTRQEREAQNGVAHFLEHMMFKGTERRTPREIARGLEVLGGHINAFTSKEQTCYYVEILDEHLPLAIDLLSDILCHSTFPDTEITKEREVIIEEIKALEDTPDELVQDVFVEKLFPGHSLGYQILGSLESVRNMTRDDLLSFYNQFYRTENIVIAAAGNLDHQQLLDWCQRYFLFTDGFSSSGNGPLPKAANGDFVFKRPVQQAHLCTGVPGLAFAHPRKLDLLVLNAILGGGMGSRLFQNIREKHALAYGIYSFLDFFHDGGLLGVYLGTQRKNYQKALDLLNNEFADIRRNGVEAEELAEAKSQLKGNLVLGLESTASRMNRLAITEIYQGRFLTMDELIQRIEAVSLDSLHQTADNICDPQKFLNVSLIPGK